MRESLESAGFAVHEGGDGLEALDLVDKLKPELIFLDAMMPRVDGFAACVETRKRPYGAHVPVLMVTGLDDTVVDRPRLQGRRHGLHHQADQLAAVQPPRPIPAALWPHQRKLHEAMERAEGASRAKTEFLASMSHELRTPLNAIIGFSEVLKRELLGPLGQERYREYSKDINESGVHLLNLISDILEYSKSESGKLRLTESELDLTQLMTSVIRQLTPRAEVAGVSLHRDGVDQTIRFLGDERKLRQVLLNLLSNAIKFTPMGGEVRVALTRDDRGRCPGPRRRHRHRHRRRRTCPRCLPPSARSTTPGRAATRAPGSAFRWPRPWSSCMAASSPSREQCGLRHGRRRCAAARPRPARQPASGGGRRLVLTGLPIGCCGRPAGLASRPYLPVLSFAAIGADKHRRWPTPTGPASLAAVARQEHPYSRCVPHPQIHHPVRPPASHR